MDFSLDKKLRVMHSPHSFNYEINKNSHFLFTHLYELWCFLQKSIYIFWNDRLPFNSLAVARFNILLLKFFIFIIKKGYKFEHSLFLYNSDECETKYAE